MITALISFLGGSVFRMLWGEISAFITAKQEHKFEVERMRLQAELDAAQHGRSMASTRLQAELGVQTIRVQAEATVSGLEADAWLTAVGGTTATVGVAWVDAWNGIIRPTVASWSVIMITLHFAHKSWLLDDNGWALCGAALGIYLADRTLFKRGK